ncbi:MAG: hypothetical protein COW00_19005 [Bdellovibrio sp. CG12_big_fil_rev_8_21_14_0_65_39_13]|nr:MAG: hypothetical protein COW78_17270 [Bdellovibrio sp. CG22_combo_CG10-13_8_21_14_all_39_27]PIQ57787.1 MAG: hypothetical protein COW00_19005 [Bdellovibrio sp. CG12_big_fil_rev_8_21_14_0_65_39_13]PIR34661.1 MAG: hypothetical protein COV37_12055 [Bdellovibrio sp. CG11_big_fil_rev_8_21_14_0_20_39_38]PJB54099.1 MAG: hypothetical protein CO099_03415 [Bdellovibrio sp. CG_4_9_14_3_um_filter_39_7]
MNQRFDILLVDDDPHYLNLMHSILKNHGLMVQTASNGEEALKHLELGHCDLLVTDLFLPMSNGLELSKKAYLKMPVVVVAKEDESGSFDVNIGHYSHCFLDKKKLETHLVRACDKARERFGNKGKGLAAA